MSNKEAVELLKSTIIEEGGMGHYPTEPPLEVCQDWLEEEFDEVWSLEIVPNDGYKPCDKVVKIGDKYIKYRFVYEDMKSLDSLQIVEKKTRIEVYYE